MATEKYTPADQLILANPEVLDGRPCIRGTRVSVEHVLELLASGASREAVLTAHPQVTCEGFEAALFYAARAVRAEARRAAVAIARESRRTSAVQTSDSTDLSREDRDSDHAHPDELDLVMAENETNGVFFGRDAEGREKALASARAARAAKAQPVEAQWSEEFLKALGSWDGDDIERPRVDRDHDHDFHRDLQIRIDEDRELRESYEAGLAGDVVSEEESFRRVRGRPDTTDREGYVTCLETHGISLKAGKMYKVIADAESEKRGWVRVVDETGEDYSFPRAMFKSEPDLTRKGAIYEALRQSPLVGADLDVTRESDDLRELVELLGGTDDIPAEVTAQVEAEFRLIADEIEFEKLRERKAKAQRELLDELGYEPATPEELDAVRDEWK
jgi:uncharacterized protein (DUF433 family)